MHYLPELLRKKRKSRDRNNLLNALHLIEKIVADPSPAASAKYASEAGRIEASTWIKIGHLIAEERQSLTEKVDRTIAEIKDDYISAMKKSASKIAKASAAANMSDTKQIYDSVRKNDRTFSAAAWHLLLTSSSMMRFFTTN